MAPEQKHEMKLINTHPTGAEEWVCPECGRHFIAQWSPKFRRVILENGNEKIVHTGQGTEIKAQISIQPMDDNPADHTELGDVWKQFLKKLDIDPDDPGDTPKQ